MYGLLTEQYQPGQTVWIQPFGADVHVVAEQRDDVEVAYEVTDPGQAINPFGLVGHLPKGATVTARVPQGAKVNVSTHGAISTQGCLTDPVLYAHAGIKADQITGDSTLTTLGGVLTVEDLAGNAKVAPATPKSTCT